MGLLNKLFRNKLVTSQPPELIPPPHSPPPPGAPATMQVWDAYGRLAEIPREEWRTKVLPLNFRQQWDNPDGLANLIVSSLHDGFIIDCLEPARQLQRIDPQPHRGATLLGVVLLQLQEFGEAEQVLSAALQRHGEEGSLLTNLAKAYSGQGDEARAETTLWRALETDPNQDNGLLWYAAMQRERGGPEAELEAFRRVAALPQSWRAQLWLARRALESKDLPIALELYREVLARVHPAPADLLMQISGDLGNHGHLKQLVELCQEQVDLQLHGLQVGNNLLKAYVELGDAPRARRILEQLYAQQRPDWKEHLLFWEQEIDKLDKGYGPVPPTQSLECTILTLEGPLWAREGTLFSELLPAKPATAPSIGFISGSAAVPMASQTEQAVLQPSDARGRFTRGVPMFLAEQVHLRTPARAIFFVPWMKQGGFLLSGTPWEPEMLELLEPRPAYFVLLHLEAQEDPWRAQLSLVQTLDNSVMTAWEQTVDPDNLSFGISAISDHLFRCLHTCAEVPVAANSEWLFPPAGSGLGHYIIGVEEALAVSCAAMMTQARHFLHAERCIIDHLLEIALEENFNVSARLLLLSTLEKEARRRPDIGQEYRQRIEQLQREYPLAQPAQGLAQAALARVYSRMAA